MIRSINTVATPTGHTIYLACDLAGIGHSLWCCNYNEIEAAYGKWHKMNMPTQVPPTPVDLRFSAEELMNKKEGVDYVEEKQLETQIASTGIPWVDEFNKKIWSDFGSVAAVDSVVEEKTKEQKEDYFSSPIHILKPLTKELLEELFAKIEKPSQKISFATGRHQISSIDLLNEVHHRGVEISGCIISSISTDGESIDITVNKIIKEEPTEIDLLNARIRELEEVNEKLKVALSQPMKPEVEPVEQSFIEKRFNKTE